MTVMDRIKSKISSETKAPIKPMQVKLPISEGELLPWKGLVFKISKVGEEEFTAKCMGLTHARARKLGMA